MFCIIKQVFTVLLSFGGSLARKFVSLSNDNFMARRTFIDLSLFELNYYPFMISQHKCNGSYIVINDLFTKTCDLSKTKSVKAKVFNVMTRIYEAKAFIKHISCD